MPEITDAQEREYRRYQELGTPDAVADRLKKADKAEQFETDNKAQRDEIRDLKKKVPAEGSVVLTADEAKRWDAFQQLGKTPEDLAAGLTLSGDDVKRWEAFQALGKTPEEITTAMQEGEAAKGELGKITKRQAVRKFGATAGFKNPDAFASLPGALDMEFEERTEKVGGADTPRVYVKLPDGKEALLDLAFVRKREDWAPLAAALEAGDDKGASRGTEYRRDPVEGGGGGSKTAEDHAKAVRGSADYTAL